MLAYVDNRRLARNSDFGGLINLASFSVSKFLTQKQSCCDLAPQRLTVRVATGASTRATLRGNTLYLMPND